MDLEEWKEEAAAVLRAHGALHSLHFAAQEGMTDQVAPGIATGQDVNARDTCECTPLDLAVENCYHKEDYGKIVETLVESKADLSARCFNEIQTPLHVAAEKDHGKIVVTLVEAKSDVCARDKWKRTPLHLSAEWGHGKIVETLVEA